MSRKKLLEFMVKRDVRKNVTARKVEQERMLAMHKKLVESFSLLRFSSIPYAIVGGQAIRFHVYPRETSDIDILMSPENWEKAMDLVGGHDAHQLMLNGPSMTGVGFKGDSGNGEEVEFDFLWNERWGDEALSSAKVETIGKVISKPFLVLMKFESGRSLDSSDIHRLVGTLTVAERRASRKLLKEYSPNELEDFDLLIELLKSGWTGTNK